MDIQQTFGISQDAAAIEDTQTREQVIARLIEYDTGHFISVPQLTTYAIVEDPLPQLVPRAAQYAYGMLPWQHGYIPMIDLRVLFYRNTVLSELPRYALIVGYQDVAQQGLLFGAIALNKLPTNVMVCDDDQCNLPDDSPLWRELAISCFAYEGNIVPIIDTTRLFSSYHMWPSHQAAE